MTVQNELLSDEEHRKIEELVEQEEGGVHRFASWIIPPFGTRPTVR